MMIACGTNEYLCSDGSCTFATRCDGYNDCADGSDENGCSAAQIQMNPGYVNPNVQRPSGARKHMVSVLLVVGSLMTIILGLMYNKSFYTQKHK
ncbi:hypothetical protein KUTeg_014432 [Tegillarca granosa]|uniref:Uncharacterized protein n=1 Tax=Tegillarca granosa TaxID=220873 RepID=A0ABQ9EWN7_TEGGR|nr:hypothetical protein KUTeg_014432 [Tegillarca granosa]